MPLSTRTVTGTYRNTMTGEPLTGSVDLAPYPLVWHDTTGKEVRAGGGTIPLAGGAWSRALVTTDAAGVDPPTGRLWRLTERIDGQPVRTRYFVLPLGDGTPLDVTQLVVAKPGSLTYLPVQGPMGPQGPAGPKGDPGEPATPASTVVAETSFGQAAVAGTSTAYARQDHTHGTPPAIDVQVFTASGVWNKPSWANIVTVHLLSGGGGGGSGRRGLAGTVRCGGGGGGGGSCFVGQLQAAVLPATVSVTVGAGGPGGAARTTDDTDGQSGTIGGGTLFGTFARTGNTSAGGGGTSSAGTGGSAGVGTTAGAQGGTASGTGGAGNVGNPGVLAAASGGAGGGITSGNVASAGGNGGTNGAINGGTGGVVGGAGPTSGTDAPVGSGLAGGGGGGGAASTTGAGQSGANGARYGAGGGGGGASVNGSNSGAGGAGADGIAIIISYP